MLCPACKADMFVLEFDLIEIDYCPDCTGVWLDSGELEIIGERAGALQGELLLALEEQKGERPRGPDKRRCPICRKTLLRIRTRGKNPIVLDRCPAQHGLWFDRGELQAVVRAAGASEDSVLVRFFENLEAHPGNEKGPTPEERS